MMLQKALKMDAPEDFNDFLSDFHLVGNKVDVDPMHIDPNNWNKVGVLTMVMHPPGVGAGSGPGSSAKVFHAPFVQPTAYSAGGHAVYSPYMYPPHLAHAPSHVAKSTPVGPDSMSSAPQASTTASFNPAPSIASTSKAQESKDEGLRLLLSPWQQMMYVPPQQALVIDRMHSGARRFVVLDFGAPVLLTDMVIPACNDLVSLSIDIWVQREEIDGQRLIVASDISMRSLVICDLQPPPVCRYLKVSPVLKSICGSFPKIWLRF